MGKSVIRENDVGPKLLQLVEEIFLAVDPAGDEWYVGPFELVFHELGIHGNVFEDENSKWFYGHPDIRVHGRVDCHLPSRCLL
jgi:hypothetical protein